MEYRERFQAAIGEFHACRALCQILQQQQDDEGPSSSWEVIPRDCVSLILSYFTTMDLVGLVDAVVAPLSLAAADGEDGDNMFRIYARKRPLWDREEEVILRVKIYLSSLESAPLLITIEVR